MTLDKVFDFAAANGLPGVFGLAVLLGIYLLGKEAVQNGFSIRVNGRKQ